MANRESLEEAQWKIWQGIKLKQQGDLEKAIGYYRRAIEVDPKSPELRLLLASALKQKRQIDLAKQSSQQNSNNLTQANSLLSGMEKEVGIILKNDNPAEISLQKSLTILPSINSTSVVSLSEKQSKIAELYLRQADIYTEQKQWQKAIAASQNAIALQPQLAEAYKIWGNALQKLGQEGEAIGCYTKALEIQPDMAQVYASVGSLFAKQQKWTKAIEYLQTSLAYNPQLAGAYRNLAKIWEGLGEAEKAWSCLFKALDLEPELMSQQQYFEFANDLLQQKEFERAIALYKYAISVDENFQEAYLKLASVLKQLNRHEEAQFYYQKSLAINNRLKNGQDDEFKPISKFLGSAKKKSDNLANSKQVISVSQSILAAKETQQKLLPSQTQLKLESEVKSPPNSVTRELNIGQKYLEKQQWNEAITHYQTLTRSHPNLGVAYESLAHAYRQVGRKSEAVRAYYMFCSLEPELVSGQKHLDLGNLLLRKNRIKEAISCYKRAIKVKPELLEAYLNLGKALVELKDYRGAFSCYQKLLERNKDNEAVFFLLGQISAKLENWDSVINCCRQAIKLKPDYWEAYHNLGDAYLKQQNFAAAVRALSEAVKINPQSFWSYQNLGDAYIKLENWREAVNVYQSAIAIKNDFMWSHYNLAQAYSKLFEWQKAIAAYREAIALQDDFAEAYAHLANALVREEKWTEAIDYYETAIKLDPRIDVTIYRNLKEAQDRHQEIIEPALVTAKWSYENVERLQPPQTLPDGSPWPKISIVTPSYNQGEFIEETILSVINQNYPNVEYILIDGGSRDETMSIVDRYRQHFSYVISETDKGQSNAINKGLAIASGEILTWLNSDDRLAPGALYAVALGFYTSGADAVAGLCQIYRDGVEIEQHLTSCPDGVISLEDILNLENCWLQGKFFYQPEVMFTREIWEKAGGRVDESLYYSMDYEMWARFAAEEATLKVIGHPVAQYRMHEKQKTNVIEKYRPELLEVRESLVKRFNVFKSDSASTRQKRSLKIAVLNDTGDLGGAGIAQQRINQALMLAGHRVVSVAGTLDWSLTPVDCTVEDVTEVIAEIDPDLLILGNLHNFKAPLDILEKLSSQYPTVFVMHDQWLLTGRCGYTKDCENYNHLCDSHCPTWEQYPSLAPEKIKEAFTRKQSLLNDNSNLAVLCDSKWLREWSRYAYLNQTSWKNYIAPETKFQHLYYGLDLQTFHPHDKVDARRRLDLPEDKFIILTGSQSLEDERKGFKYLLKALEITELEDILVLCFGHDFESTSLNIQSIGYIENKALLARYYSAANLFISPALEEAFGQTFIEAAACGTPAVGFGVGGIREAISDRITGRIVKQKNPEALAEMILELYSDREQLELLSHSAPLQIANNFSLASSYHSIINALDNNGLLSDLEMSPVSKFIPGELPQIEYVSIKGANTISTSNTAQLPQVREITMDTLQGSGWFPAEKVNGVWVRWMEKLGAILVEPIDLLSSLQIEIAIVTAVDLRLLEEIEVKINGNPIKTAVNCDRDGFVCRGDFPANLLTVGMSFLVSIEVLLLKQLSVNDSRKGSLLVRSLLVKSLVT